RQVDPRGRRAVEDRHQTRAEHPRADPEIRLLQRCDLHGLPLQEHPVDDDPGADDPDQEEEREEEGARHDRDLLGPQLRLLRRGRTRRWRRMRIPISHLHPPIATANARSDAPGPRGAGRRRPGSGARSRPVRGEARPRAGRSTTTRGRRTWGSRGRRKTPSRRSASPSVVAALPSFSLRNAPVVDPGIPAGGPAMQDTRREREAGAAPGTGPTLDDMEREVRLFVGTKRGLFVLRSSDDRRSWSVSPPLLAGREVYHAVLDPRDRRTVWAATDHAVWGAHIHRSDDGGETWTVLENGPHHDGERGLKAIWALTPGPGDEPDALYAGIEPAGLFVSRDRGESWQAVEALNEHPTNRTWQPAGGALALHSILIDPRTSDRIYCALSAGGVYRSDDGGRSWTPANRGTRADFLPGPAPEAGQCVHRLVLCPARPDRLYQQNHCGVYRSDDRGESWTEITGGLPSE